MKNRKLKEIKKPIMKKLIYTLGISSILFSCSTITKVTNSNTNTMNTSESGVVMRPLLADVEVSQDRKSIEYIVPYYMNAKKEGKENAVLQFKKTHKCDYIVDAIFEIITETGKKNETKIIVNGYTASYSNIRQVDSLPKSVIQYGMLPKNVKSLDYLNTFEEKIPSYGIEFSTLAYTGVQVDKILSNSNNRFYLSVEGYGLLGGSDIEINADFIDKSNDNSIGAIESLSIDSYNTASAGIMREFPLFNFMKFRLQGGLNILTGSTSETYPSLSSDYGLTNGDYESLNFFSLGLRVGAGIDIRIYKSLSAIAKVHYNQNLLNIMGKPDWTFQNNSGDEPVDVESFKINKIRFEERSLINLSVGLRFVF